MKHRVVYTIPKRKTEKDIHIVRETPIGGLIVDLENAREDIKDAANTLADAPVEYAKDAVNELRAELIRLFEDNEIDQSVKYKSP